MLENQGKGGLANQWRQFAPEGFKIDSRCQGALIFGQGGGNFNHWHNS
ncbi:MAG TPA: hypothetical protein PKW33_15710 [Anaerolineaceae bacterium]|nr:hypothetical protein [Anaerolineaceae bacterium]HPN53042.1 hypothetical protein [Anaerolineaceae bacterium]